MITERIFSLEFFNNLFVFNNIFVISYVRYLSYLYVLCQHVIIHAELLRRKRSVRAIKEFSNRRGVAGMRVSSLSLGKMRLKALTEVA